jgi:hypothetical protein
MRGHRRNLSIPAPRTIPKPLLAALTVCLLVSQLMLLQTAPAEEIAVHHYVLIFRPTRTLTPDELKQRAGEIQVWVRRVNQMGITLDPKALGKLAIRFSQENGAVVMHDGSADPTLTNIVFFDAAGQDQAMEVAHLHPGLHYGVSVELRDWTPPVAPLPQAK